MNEGLDNSDLRARGVVSRRTVAKGDGAVTVEVPGGVGSRRCGEGVGRNTDNSEERVFVTSAHRSEKLLDVVHSVVRMTPGAHKDSSEAGNVSGGRLGDLVEAEASFGFHGAVSSHPHLCVAAGGGDHEVVANKMKLIILPGLLEEWRAGDMQEIRE